MRVTTGQQAWNKGGYHAPKEGRQERGGYCMMLLDVVVFFAGLGWIGAGFGWLTVGGLRSPSGFACPAGKRVAQGK